MITGNRQLFWAFGAGQLAVKCGAVRVTASSESERVWKWERERSECVVIHTLRMI